MSAKLERERHMGDAKTRQEIVRSVLTRFVAGVDTISHEDENEYLAEYLGFEDDAIESIFELFGKTAEITADD